MIGSWLVKVVVGIAVVGFLVIELGSPLIARAQADDAAHEVANETAFRVGTGPFTQADLDAACSTEAEEQEVELKSCALNETGEVAVTVTKQARTVVLGKIDALADWYRAEASATAKPR